jgi:hypothetical protein
MTQGSVPICVYLYNRFYDEGGDMDMLSASTVWTIALTLVSCWWAIFGFFMLYVIVPKNRKTFWSFQTGWEKSQSYFLDNVGDDGRRSAVVECDSSHWRSLEAEVREWSLSNWMKWERERPDWFTAVKKAAFPDNCIPAEAIAVLGTARQRRMSASLSVAEKETLRATLGLGLIVGRGEGRGGEGRGGG